MSELLCADCGHVIATPFDNGDDKVRCAGCAVDFYMLKSGNMTGIEYPKPFEHTGACTTSSTGPETLTIESLNAMLDLMPKCPIAEWMTAQGFNPKDGGILILPESMRNEFGSLPSYAKVSKLVEQPVMIRSTLIGYDTARQTLDLDKPLREMVPMTYEAKDGE
jgi:hypothetical protein